MGTTTNKGEPLCFPLGQAVTPPPDRPGTASALSSACLVRRFHCRSAGCAFLVDVFYFFLFSARDLFPRSSSQKGKKMLKTIATGVAGVAVCLFCIVLSLGGSLFAVVFLLPIRPFSRQRWVFFCLLVFFLNSERVPM